MLCVISMMAMTTITHTSFNEQSIVLLIYLRALSEFQRYCGVMQAALETYHILNIGLRENR